MEEYSPKGSPARIDGTRCGSNGQRVLVGRLRLVEWVGSAGLVVFGAEATGGADEKNGE